MQPGDLGDFRKSLAEITDRAEITRICCGRSKGVTQSRRVYQIPGGNRYVWGGAYLAVLSESRIAGRGIGEIRHDAEITLGPIEREH